MQEEALILSTDLEAGIRILTINRPKALNALNLGVLEALDAQINALQGNSQIKAVLITGQGEKSFVAGADIKAMSELSVTQASTFSAYGHLVLEKLAKLPQIVIAAVNGFCLGGGCELALACDLIYASEKAVFGQPEVALGLIPGFGGTQRLSRKIGLMPAMELVVSGKKINAQEAQSLGLCLAVLPHEGFLEAVLDKARLINKQSFSAVARAKAVMYQGIDIPLPYANQLEAQHFGACFDSFDAKEGMQAFMERREAKFKA
jgi:enoyl-CoA hydratase